MVFTDESRFSIYLDSHRVCIWRAPGTSYNQEIILEQPRYGGDGLLVWGGIILVPEQLSMSKTQHDRHYLSGYRSETTDASV